MIAIYGNMSILDEDGYEVFLAVYNSIKNWQPKQEAIKSMIKHFEVTIKPKNIKEDEYFK